MTAIPKDKALDSTLSLLREGYHFLPRRHHQLHSDIFQVRLLGEKAVCLSGAEGATLFYNQALFQREGALPRRILTTLMGQDGVQTLDDAAHQHRKALFMRLMTPGSLHQYSTLVAENWRAYLRRWEQLEQVELFPEVEEVLCRAACAWAGVPFEEKDIKPLARDLSAMIDAFGGVGPRHAKGKRARHRAERWVGKMIDQVRAGKQYAVEGKALHAISWHRELDGKLLSTHVASVELLNLLRPIVAIGRYVVFEALALHEHPRCAEQLRTGPSQYPEWFAQEVRRFFPFTPLLGARVRTDFAWRGHRFRKGTLTLLDVHGINHDERQWEHPHLFRPERFREWNGSPFNFIPQGGGDYTHNHRCAGEWLTIETLKTTAVLLASSMTYEVPEQDLSVDMTRMPTLPASGFVIRNVRATSAAVAPIATAPTVAAAAAAAGCPFHQ